jgi:TfoX/Sxy family transcriptional regulator of competence genes
MGLHGAGTAGGSRAGQPEAMKRTLSRKSRNSPADDFTDPRLIARVRSLLAGVEKVKERRMFGGTGFMVRGHLCVTARPSRIMCRIDPSTHESAIKLKGCRGVIMRGRSYQGYVHVAAAAVQTKAALASWVKRALKFNRTLSEVIE